MHRDPSVLNERVNLEFSTVTRHEQRKRACVGLLTLHNFLSKVSNLEITFIIFLKKGEGPHCGIQRSPFEGGIYT